MSNQIKHTVRSLHHSTACSRNLLSTGVSKMMPLMLTPLLQSVECMREWCDHVFAFPDVALTHCTSRFVLNFRTLGVQLVTSVWGNFEMIRYKQASSGQCSFNLFWLERHPDMCTRDVFKNLNIGQIGHVSNLGMISSDITVHALWTYYCERQKPSHGMCLVCWAPLWNWLLHNQKSMFVFNFPCFHRYC